VGISEKQKQSQFNTDDIRRKFNEYRKSRRQFTIETTMQPQLKKKTPVNFKHQTLTHVVQGNQPHDHQMWQNQREQQAEAVEALSIPTW
jgi:hypothetical protein